ncbi:DUF1648 domain-containing protein [Ureibacillus manganicus]|uniref:DUF1648 domain-containing protein n=1 Tax=Ureibacillus manganicus DSM 26584 TaxID=1384049 RepID=A0A0A3I6P9_9BACL|nr:DUF1648 domain-containing protein [Ureibacillus manganicus]KGR78363.1 hypothetical protein CD29_11640 [Ureibacillus manganicus DSM 26584]
MYNPYRPILDIPKTRLEKVLNAICGAIFLFSILYAVVSWPQLPDQIPGHFNSLGEVDRWGSKYEIIILPVIGLFIFVLMNLFEKAPHMHNYPKRLNENNVKQFYLNSRLMLNMTKNMCLIIFAILIIQIIRVAKGEIQSLGGWFLPVFIGLVMIPMIIGIYKISKIK